MNTKTRRPDISHSLYTPRRLYVLACTLTSIAVITLLLKAPPASAQGQPNGTTVFRCIDISGVISFADAPCKQSTSTRLRIEHSMVQSAPISMAEQQRLRALEQRLKTKRAARKSGDFAEHKRKLAETQAGAERCLQARRGLTEIRSRKRRGYPARQAERIDNEERALEGEISAWCRS